MYKIAAIALLEDSLLRYYIIFTFFHLITAELAKYVFLIAIDYGYVKLIILN